MGVAEFAVAVGLGLAGCGGVYYYMRGDARADALFDKRNDREAFYENLKSDSAKGRFSYALLPVRYAKKYIKNHPLPDMKQ
jgi:hypothetical protein